MNHVSPRFSIVKVFFVELSVVLAAIFGISTRRTLAVTAA